MPRVIASIKGRGDYRPTSANRIRGRGDYFGDILGGLGSKIGNTIQGTFRDITGFGDYRTHGPKSNSLSKLVARAADTSSHNLGSSEPSQNPFVMGAMSVKFGGKAPRIQHREFITNIAVPDSGDAFSTTAFSIQPGLSGPNSLFPWGSSVFGNFENYRMHGLVLEYATTSSNFSSSSALGSVSMSTVYDAEAPILTTLAAVNNNEFTTTAPPCSSFYHPVECAPSQGATDVKFIRKSNTVVSGTDSRFDDVGVFQISLDGISAPPGTVIGQLWASYDIEVLKAVLPDLHLGTTGQWTFSDLTDWNAMFFNPVANPSNSLPAILSPSNDILRVTLPKGYNGNFLLTVSWTIAAASPLPEGSSRSVYVSSLGSDVSQVALFPDASGGFTATQKSLNDQYQGTLSIAISTIAENVSQNFVEFVLASYGGHSFQGVSTTLLIVPLDNDVVGSGAQVARLLRRNPGLAQLASMLSLNLPSATTAMPSGPNGCQYRQGTDHHTAQAAVAASSVVKTNNTPVVGPALSHPLVQRMKTLLTQGDYVDDKWVDVGASNALDPTSRMNRQPLSCDDPPTALRNSLALNQLHANSIAAAEESLAAAIRSATSPSATLYR